VDQPVTLRPRFGQVLSVLVWLIAVVSAVTLVAQGNWLATARYSPGIALIAFGTWVLFWHPAVRVDDSGIDFVNLIRTRHITWPSVQRVETKYSLTIYTTAGRFSAWAAPAPSRVSVGRATAADLRGLPETTYGAGNSVALGDVPTSDSGLAGYHVRRKWEALRDAGRLESNAVEGTGVMTTWHLYTILMLAALIIGTVLGTAL
jgi:hypothetical protein